MVKEMYQLGKGKSFYSRKSQGINNNCECLLYLENKKVEHYGRNGRMVDIMVTDGILGAVQMIIDRFKTSDEIYAGKIIWDMLSDYDEDEWYSMSDEQKKEWIIKYIERR